MDNSLKSSNLPESLVSLTEHVISPTVLQLNDMFVKVPDNLGNNYVCGIPGTNRKEKMDFVRELLDAFGLCDKFYGEIFNLPDIDDNFFPFFLPPNDGTIPVHKHKQLAKVFVLSGSATDLVSGEIAKKGDIIVNEPFKEHGFRALGE